MLLCYFWRRGLDSNQRHDAPYAMTVELLYVTTFYIIILLLVSFVKSQFGFCYESCLNHLTTHARAHEVRFELTNGTFAQQKFYSDCCLRLNIIILLLKFSVNCFLKTFFIFFYPTLFQMLFRYIN